MPLAIYTSAAWTANGGITVSAGATVEVRTYGSGQPLASIFSDRAGSTPKDNPFTADAQGRFSFFAAGGAYRVKVTDGAAEHTLEYQSVGTAGERDTGTDAGQIPTNADLPNSSAVGNEPGQLVTNTNRLRQITIDGDADHTLTDAEATADIIRLTGTLTAPRELVVPDVARQYTIVNDRTGDDTTVKTAAGTGVVVPRGEVSVVRSDGVDVDWLAPSISAIDGFVKGHTAPDPEPAWAKTGTGSAETAHDLWVEVNGVLRRIPEGTSITMPTLVAGTDYAIWITQSGELIADDSFTAAPEANAKRVGGFHYAPGGNAPLASDGNWADHNGGDTNPQINEYSFWDLKWRPTAADPRGLTLVNESFWCGIYTLAADHLVGPAHRHGVSPARDGDAPQNPYGDGTQYYDDANWFNITEALAFHGFRAPSGFEFQLAAIGVLEQASRGNDPVLTGLSEANTGSSNPDERFTSHWGCIQMTGVIRPWGREALVSGSGDGDTTALQGRGGRNRFDRFALFGGRWGDGSDSGSRYVLSGSSGTSSSHLGGRGVCDHLIVR